MTHPEVSAIIPCLNEEATLAICIKKAQKAFEELGISGEVVIGDNGSTDKSIEIANKLGARVVPQKIKGYGAAIQAAANAAKGKYLIMADADDSYDWSNIAPFINELDKGYDFVIGNRFEGGIQKGAMPFLHRYLGNPILSKISSIFYRVKIRDFHCGMRAFTKEAYSKMNLQTEGMEFATEMVVRAAQEKLKIKEVPIKLFPDKRNRKPHLRTFRDGWRHLRFIMTYAPNYLYLAPGVSIFIIGMLLQALLVTGPLKVGGFYLGSHFLALGLLLTLTGINIITQGLIAKVILFNQTKQMENTIVRLIQSKFSLERGIIIGCFVLATGLMIDGSLLLTWLGSNIAMDSSIHLAFVGSGLIVLGINIIFSSFLLGMCLL
ncbi:MAG: glycosyltransferase family 2 protein [Proteobacteria bacterium]|nr:glycosyltransferase family 2 protein [Pseudomonadota bacterium]MBU1388821.1 glycosyltransferase family 2 protein [Pseudomonadota bacterium]MBU1543162.1 glycosyltransferase family 2 protein [Pseudomonadota bacterium]